MSVIASRPEGVAMPYTTVPHESHIVHTYKDSAYTVAIQTIPSRTTSVSSYSSNFSNSTTPTVYSPTSPTSPTSPGFSYRAFKTATPPPKPTEPVFRRLPQEVYDCILNQLEVEHNGPQKSGCLTCFQRDLHSLALTSRSWEKAVRSKLYNRIHIIGNDSPAQLKKYKMKRGSRLKLLRRTLRERKLLANLVLELRVPEIDLLLVNGRQTGQLQEYRDLVASVVMVCPNLEKLVGLTVPYYHEFDRLTYALSTRKKLKEHTWILGDPIETPDRARSQSPEKSLEPQQVFEFLNNHVSWSNLETLMLHSLNMNNLVGHGVFLRMFNFLPSLRHLCVSSFGAEAFTDRTLLFLPPLESLRLESLRGITDTGLAQYASRTEAQGLKSLTLIELNIESLLAISKMLASLRQLERFSIQTTSCPTLQSEGMIFQPLLASASLKHLHWDVASPDPINALSNFDSVPFAKPPKHIETPNSHLAQSIIHSGFPRLETLRAPSDIQPAGILQAVCQPIKRGQALIPADRYSLPRSSHGSVSARPLALPGGNNLTSARIRAQTFIDMAAKDTETGMKVIVTDHSDSYVPDNALEDDESEFEIDAFGERVESTGQRHNLNRADDTDGPVTVHEFRMPAYMGRVGGPNSFREASIPRFKLRPDISGADVDGGLVGWRHLLATNQSLTYAAGTGMGVNAWANRSGSIVSSVAEEPLSPASTTTSRFGGWGSISGRSQMATSPNTPITPITPSFPSSNAPPWSRDSCTGHWNHSHTKGKDWWFHIERDRPGAVEPIGPKQFF
ncbi:conserved predicted protein [Paecilomyces variotii No. 5]|uniref:F-box domain-containing protein n=1 Tax=Byssochlamys spectabilis (strain No. 5 / NBRC 109023) TaxID=1356009 RepID=V5FCI6_BYSSN|nr:conserved predicted protein [Paecilomyces variotii No. 5]